MKTKLATLAELKVYAEPAANTDPLFADLLNLIADLEEARRLLGRSSGELHVVGSYRDNAETAGLYITAKAQHELATAIDAFLAEDAT